MPFGRAAIHRSGRDVTLVAIGATVSHALQAAEQLATEGIDAEVVDPRTLVPLDEATIVASVARTGRLVVADESREGCSAASHIAAVVAERAFDALVAPPRRVTVPSVSLPYAPALERGLLPDAGRIVAAARSLFEKR